MKARNLLRKATFAVSTSPFSRSTGIALCAAAVLLSGSPACLAQASSGVTGTVTDSTGAVISGAAITITNNETQTTTNAVSSSSGTYAVSGLNPGRYTVTVTAPGFSKLVKDQVNIEVTVTSTIDFSLQTGSSEQTVTVNADLIALNTTQPELGTTIEPIVVSALPVAIGGGRGRQIDTLQFLAPGVTGNTFSHRVNGGVDFEQEILYNGIPAPQAETAGMSGNFNPPFELVGEFRLERSTFSAKYGLAQGAVTYQTASGTNTYHGDAFYINRNEFFDARGFFNSTTPLDRENNYGFTVGGPASIPHLYNAKDRTFFLFALDFAKTNNSQTGFGTVPTVLQKTGDFSDFVDSNGQLIPIFDPLTGRQFQYNGRLNVIDPARISAVSRTVIPAIPDPDRAGLVNNITNAPNAFPTVNHTWGFTVDHTLTPTQSLHYAEWRNTFNSIAFDNDSFVPTTSILQSGKGEPRVGTVFLLNYVNAITPKLVATAGASWIGEINNELNLKGAVPFAGTTPSPIGNAFPSIHFDGQNAPTNWGAGNGGETVSNNRKLGVAAVTNFLWTRGRHTFNIGGEMRRSYQDDNECQTCGGQFSFSQRTTADPKNLGSTGNSFASFLLGQADSAQRIFANELRLRNLLIAPYIQDDIKFTPKLTVNLGLRWDLMLPFTENGNQIVFLDPNAPNPAAGGIRGSAASFSDAPGGVTRADIHYKNFGPRVGFAYALNEKTVIQAGYNVSYLNGGAYEYGTSKVATSYGNLLQGSFTAASLGGTQPGYGSWDARPLPAPGAVPLNARLGIGTTIRAFDPRNSGVAPYLQQWNANVQRQLPWNTFLQVAYVGNHALRLPGQLNNISQGDPAVLLPLGALLRANINDPAAVAAGIKTPYTNFSNDRGGNATVARALSPFPQYNRVYNNFDQTGAATYNGLQMSLEKRFSNGLSFLTSYTLSRTMSNVDSGFTTFASTSENKYNQFPEYTVAGSDVKHVAKISGAYDLPIGPGKRFVNNKGITGQILGGIQIGFITQYNSGTPFGIGQSNDNPLGCDGCFNRPNRVSSVPLNSPNYSGRNFTIASSQTTQRYLDPAAFSSTVNQFVLGNAQRNYSELRSPGYANEDIKASKRFALGERVNFLLEMNYFNVLNRTLFNGPNTNISDVANFGRINSGQSNTQRQGQLSGRINF